MVVLFASCDNNQQTDEYYKRQAQIKELCHKVFTGKHELRRLKSIDKTESSSSASGGFLIAFGTYTSESKTSIKTMIKFSWQLYNGEYVLSEVPYEAFRIHIDSSVIKPYIIFDYNGYSRDDVLSSFNAFMPQYYNDTYYNNNGINYITLYCNEKQYNEDINLTNL